MVIVATLYAILIWLVFLKFKWLPWNRTSKSIVAIVGITLLLVVVGLLNYYTPSGRIAVMGRVVEITPDISGRVEKVFVKANTPIKKGQPLFQIDREQYQIEVSRLQGALAEAQANVAQLKASVARAIGSVDDLRAQLKLARIKLRDVGTLVKQKVTARVELDKANAEVDSLEGRLATAEEDVKIARIKLASTVNGEHTSIVQTRAQLDAARLNLRETTIYAPADGYASGLTLTAGHRVTALKPAMPFVQSDSIRINAVFSQNGFRKIKPGTRVRLSLVSVPGKIFESKILEVFGGIGQGQVPVSGVLPKIGSIGITTEYGVRLSIPKDLPANALLLGMSGTATVFSDDAGAIALLAHILLWLKAILNFI
jgi:multidrug resistance efflux pump